MGIEENAFVAIPIENVKWLIRTVPLYLQRILCSWRPQGKIGLSPIKVKIHLREKHCISDILGGDKCYNILVNDNYPFSKVSVSIQ